MKSRWILIFLLLSFFSCEDDKLGNKEDEKNTPEEIALKNEHFFKGWVRIKLTPGSGSTVSLSSTNGIIQTGVSEIDGLAAKLGASKIERVFPDAGKFEARSRKAGLHLWYDIYFDESIPVTRAVSDFSQIPGIDIVEPIRKIQRAGGKMVKVDKKLLSSGPAETATAPFNDPDLYKQWHYHNDGSLSDSKAGADINLFDAWKVTAGNPEVIVAVVDGGIDVEHEDLSDNVWRNEDESPGYTDNDGNGYKGDIFGWNFVSDIATIKPHSHGTHVAGTIAAVNNNNLGVGGIAGGTGQHDGVRIMSCQIFEHDPNDPDKDIGTRYIPRAIKYGADNGAVICQNSWSFTFEEGQTPVMDNATKAAIDYFIENAGKDENGNQEGPMNGGIVIFAAGNENKDYDVYPAKYERVLSVASMTPDFTKAYYSNYADWVDITAPGGSYRYGGRFNNECPVYSTLPNSQYGYMQGTSMACPHVSGVAALVVSRFGVGHPGLTPEEVRERLVQSVKDIYLYNPTYRGKLGSGYLDAAMALQVDQGIAPDPVTDLAIEWGANFANLTWTVTRDEDNGSPDRYTIYWSTQSLNGIDFDRLPASVHTESVDVTKNRPGETIIHQIKGLSPLTAYYFGIAGIDRFGNRSAVTFSQGETISNQPPVIEKMTTGDIVLKAYQTQDIIFKIHDPEGQDYTYELQDPSGAATAIPGGDNTITVTITAANTKAGSYQARLTVTDEAGASASEDIPFTILGNHAPQLTDKEWKTLYMDKIGGTQVINLKDYFSDPDGEVLNYNIQISPEGILDAQVVNEELTFTSLKAGQGTISITASDHFGLACSRTLIFMSRDGSQAVDLYPNPVVDNLNIRMGRDVEGKVSVQLYSSAGALVLEDVVEVSPFNPGVLNMKEISGGSYVIVLKYGTQEIKRNIIKL